MRLTDSYKARRALLLSLRRRDRESGRTCEVSFAVVSSGMKQLQDDGNVVILYSSRLTLTDAQRKPFHSFAAHYGEFSLFNNEDGFAQIVFTTELHDGHTYTYRYGPYPIDEANILLIEALNRSPDPDNFPLLGGEFYNPNIRPNLMSKEGPA